MGSCVWSLGCSIVLVTVPTPGGNVHTSDKVARSIALTKKLRYLANNLAIAIPRSVPIKPSNGCSLNRSSKTVAALIHAASSSFCSFWKTSCSKAGRSCVGGTPIHWTMLSSRVFRTWVLFLRMNTSARAKSESHRAQNLILIRVLAKLIGESWRNRTSWRRRWLISTATWVTSEADSSLSNKSLRTEMVWSTKIVMECSVHSASADPSNNREMTLQEYHQHRILSFQNHESHSRI